MVVMMARLWVPSSPLLLAVLFGVFAQGAQEN